MEENTIMNRTYDYSTIQDYVSRLLKDRETAGGEFMSAKGGCPIFSGDTPLA